MATGSDLLREPGCTPAHQHYALLKRLAHLGVTRVRDALSITLSTIFPSMARRLASEVSPRLGQGREAWRSRLCRPLQLLEKAFDRRPLRLDVLVADLHQARRERGMRPRAAWPGRWRRPLGRRGARRGPGAPFGARCRPRRTRRRCARPETRAAAPPRPSRGRA